MSGETRRDRWGRYLVMPPDGGKPVGYTRATTIAKTLDSEGGLIAWKATMTVTGMMRRPGLRARWDALCAQHDSPWYSDAKDECRKLVEECAEAGGSTDRAEIGTALHALAELVDLGTTLTIDTPSMAVDITAYKQTITTVGITYDPAGIEACVVLDGYQVAGTADRLVAYLPGYELPLVADLKTGTDLQYGWQAIAVQLACYAHADAIYRQGEAVDGSQDERLPMPQVDLEQALVIHLPAGEARCELHLVDIAAGWEAFQQSIWVRSWRTRRDLARPMTVERTAVAPVVAVGAAEGSPAAPTINRDSLINRIKAHQATDDGDAFMLALSRQWPAGIPTFRSDHAHTLAELELIGQAVTAAAADIDAPFLSEDSPPANPIPRGEGEPAPRRGVNTASMGGEGSPPATEYATLPICEAVIAMLQELPADTLAAITPQLKAAGVPNLRSGKATYEHIELVTATLDQLTPA